MERLARSTEEQEAAALLKKLEDEQAADRLREVLATEAGRQLVWWVMDASGFYMTSFNGNSRDYYELGKRSIGAQLHARVVGAAGFSVFDTMRAEAKARQDAQRLRAQESTKEEDY